MRIGGGMWKGRNLPPVPGDARPTTAQSREVLFNWLGERIQHRHCLDLFAGSGALSLEAVSRGAATATMLEIDGKRCQALRKQLSVLTEDSNLSSALSVTRADALRWMRRTARQLAEPKPAPPHSWNLIFADPPYGYSRLENCLQLLTDLLAAAGPQTPECLLYLETEAAAERGAPEPWTLERQRRASDHWLRLYRLAEQ